MNQRDYIEQLENTIEVLNGKLEDTSKKLEEALGNKAGMLIPEWREESVIVKGLTRKTKVHIYTDVKGCLIMHG